MKILIVDDEPGVRIPLAIFLNGQGHTVIEAMNEDQATEAIKSNPDTEVVISDLVMKTQRSGLDVLRLAKSKLTQAKLCLTSGTLTDEAIDEAMQLGARTFSKPYSLPELAERLEL